MNKYKVEFHFSDNTISTLKNIKADSKVIAKFKALLFVDTEYLKIFDITITRFKVTLTK